MYGKGDRHAQQRRRRKNNSLIPFQNEEYLLVDGNYSNRPYKFCCYYYAYLTKNQVERHKCEQKNCTWIKPFTTEKGVIYD